MKLLLMVHVLAGVTALTGSFVAVITKTFNLAHRWHIYSGFAFFTGMCVIFVTAIPMAIITSSAFLCLIAIFSFYLAFNGWRYAKNRDGTPKRIDWVTSGLMACVSVSMLGWGGWMLIQSNSMGITMVVFGVIGAALSFTDLQGFRSGGSKGKQRIAKHLTMMLGGTIAAITAFLVTNFQFKPAFVLWLAPTVIITPLIIWWNKKIEAGADPSKE